MPRGHRPGSGKLRTTIDGQLVNALMAERAQQLRVIEGIEERGLDMTQTESYGELSSYDNHPADAGTETYEREKDTGLRQRAERVLEEIEHALRRIDAGTYTTCENCGQTIQRNRLLSIPYTAHCARCARELEEVEERRAAMRDDSWDDVADRGFAHSFRDGRDEPGYDGEDAWQEVARYGTANSPQDVPGAEDYDDLFIDADDNPGIVDVGELIVDAAGRPIQAEDDEDGDDANANVFL